jgi:ABC transport system ATP-binding/permease protein
MAPPPLLAMSDARYRIGDQVILDGASLGVGRGERLCLVGRNGAGKSTLLRLLAGEILPDSGERFMQPGARVGTLPQEPDLSAFASVAHYVAAGIEDAHGPDDHRVATVLVEPVRRRGAARGAGPRAGGRARHPAARRAH